MNAMVDVAVQQRHGHAVELLAHPSQATEARFTRLREGEKKSQQRVLDLGGMYSHIQR